MVIFVNYIYTCRIANKIFTESLYGFFDNVHMFGIAWSPLGFRHARRGCIAPLLVVVLVELLWLQILLRVLLLPWVEKLKVKRMDFLRMGISTLSRPMLCIIYVRIQSLSPSMYTRMSVRSPLLEMVHLRMPMRIA